MTLKDMSLMTAGTIGVTGGDALSFTDDGQTIQNGLHLIVPNDSDYRTRRQATVKYRPATVDAKTGVYGKDKKSISYAIPVIIEGGRVVFNTIRVEREVHPIMSATDQRDMNIIAAQLLTATASENFWANGSLS